MGFLSEIVRATRESIARGDYDLPDIVDRPTAPRPSLARAVRDRSPGALLVEFKRASPGSSVPELPERSLEEFVRRTQGAEIAGYSCLATPPSFGGSPADVARLCRSTRLPVLFKDFVVEPTQVEAARRSGASAILLIARLADAGLLGAPLACLAARARDAGLEVFLEFHDRSELSQAADVRADVYGVNVRDLDTLRMEPESAYATLRAAAHLRPLIGLSGVESASDARRFWDAGADGLLVGTAVARSNDPRTFLENLRRSARRGNA
jgi:indole-3-glycerol phosphate synthase